MKFPPIPAGCYSHRHFDVVPYHNVGLVNDLSVYPKNQPRRGDIVVAGAARPRGSMEKIPLLSKLAAAAATGISMSARTTRKRPLCLPKKPAPEGRHSGCRGREAPGLEGENFPPLLTSGGPYHRHFDVGPYHNVGLVNDLSVYPKNQPRRGDIVPAGAARPRGSKE
jgi:hypothetical protein